MRIIACSYEHIGPFADQTRTVRFLPGASLIKAPIGSGKSFLFFDGLIFGLYKRSTRPMVSRNATHGQIQVIFSHAGAQWLIIRDLKSTKAGNDSVTSKLFRVHASYEEIGAWFAARCGEEIITTHLVIMQVIASDYLEEIQAMGQKEIDTMILDLLPSREVTLSSCILMQESDNVFDMTPALRITVFKQLFDLLDMDHVRDHLAELKKNTQLRRQVLQEDMTVQHQFVTLYEQLRTLASQITQLSIIHTDPQLVEWKEQPFLVDLLQLNEQHVHLEGSILHGYDAARTSSIIQYFDKLLQEQLISQGQAQQLTVQQKELQTALIGEEQEINKLQQRLVVISGQLEQLDVDQLTTLQQKIQDIDTQVDMLWQQVPVERAQQNGLLFTSIIQAQQLMYQQITDAKQLQQEFLQYEEKETTLRTQQEQLKAHILQLEQQLARLATDRSEAEAFHCDKIQADCPYVSVIRKVATSALDEQRSYFTEQITTAREVTAPALVDTLSLLLEKKNEIHTQITQKKQLFILLGRKDLEEIFRRAEQLTTERKHYSDALRDAQNRVAQSATLLEEQQHCLQRREQLQGTYERGQKELNELTQQIAAYDTQKMQSSVLELKQLHQLFQRFEQLHGQLAGLVDQFIERQQQIRELQDKEALVKDLLQIFQKELLIVVLQDFLPVLEEVINSYLQQIVPFSLRFELPKTMQEQIELAIWIEDENGQRAVKSLSGGQRAVLRLCWILAVSTLFKQEYLLLDETINSLDQEAIGRVAELLDGFIKQREVIFYLVTHAQQIQEMPFWRRVIELEHIQKE